MRFFFPVLFQLTLAEDLDDGSCLLQTRSLQTSLSSVTCDALSPGSTFFTLESDGNITTPNTFDQTKVQSLCQPYGSEDLSCKTSLRIWDTYDDSANSAMCNQFKDYKFFSLKNYATFARTVLLDYMIRFSFLDPEKLNHDDLKGDISAIIDSLSKAINDEKTKVNEWIETLVAKSNGLPWTKIGGLNNDQVVFNDDVAVPSYQTFIDDGTSLRELGKHEVFKNKIRPLASDQTVRVQNLLKYTGQRMKRLGQSIKGLDTENDVFCDYKTAFEENRCNVQHNMKNVCLRGEEAIAGDYMCLCEYSAGQDCMYDIANEKAYFQYYEQKAYVSDVTTLNWDTGAETVWKGLKCGTDEADDACSFMQIDEGLLRSLISFFG